MISQKERIVKKEEFKVTECPECGSKEIVEDYEQGEVVCKKCGLVINDQVLNKGPEWRAFTKEEREERGRVGIPLSFSIHDKGLSTVIERVNKDAYGRSLPMDKRIEMLRLRKWQIRTRVHTSIERNLAQAMAELDRLADKLHLPPQIKERAAVIYRKALDAGLVRGRSIAAIMAGAVYAACRFSETPRTLREVIEASGLKRRDVARCYRLLLKELNLKMPIEDPVKSVSKIASRLGLPMETQSKAIEVLMQAKAKGLIAGKDPLGLAAAALYVACAMDGIKKTQKDIAMAAEVTEVTVRNRYKSLKEALGLNV